MSKMSELSMVLQELKECGEKLVGISEELAEIFSGSEEKEPVKKKCSGMKSRMTSWHVRTTSTGFKNVLRLSVQSFKKLLNRFYGFQDFIQEMMRYGKNSEYICKDRTGCKRAG